MREKNSIINTNLIVLPICGLLWEEKDTRGFLCKKLGFVQIISSLKKYLIINLSAETFLDEVP